MLATTIALLLQYKYYLLVPIALVEGPIITILAGFMIKMEVLALAPSYLCLMAGDILGDIMWYTIGRTVGQRFITKFGRYFSITPSKVLTLERVLHRRKNSILIISKLTMGLGFALVTLVTAGLVKIPLGRFVSLNLAGQVLWTATLLTVGYLFGNFYVAINNGLGKIFVVVLGVMVVIILFGLAKYWRQQTLKM